MAHSVSAGFQASLSARWKPDEIFNGDVPPSFRRLRLPHRLSEKLNMITLLGHAIGLSFVELADPQRSLMSA
jgi:hypothetical protein